MIFKVGCGKIIGIGHGSIMEIWKLNGYNWDIKSPLIYIYNGINGYNWDIIGIGNEMKWVYIYIYIYIYIKNPFSHKN